MILGCDFLPAVKAVIYARYSSDQQREESIEAQMRACSDYIANQKWVLTESYIDRALSARSDHRPEFQRMISDAKRNKFDYVVVHKLDRFSRDRYDHAYYKRELKLNGIRLISVLENLDDSPESVVLESVLEGFSEYYSRNLGREVMKGLRENALQCRHTGGVPPLGYDVGQDGKYVINEKEAAAVRYIFEAYNNDIGYDKIVRWLIDHSIKGKRGGVIAKNTLHDILLNEKYIGVYVFNRSAAKDASGKRNGHKNKNDEDIIRIEGGMPEIINKDLFEKVAKKMKANKSGTHRAKEPYLLSGLLFCGKCGGAMVGCSRGKPRSETEKPLKYYECNIKKRTHECDMGSVNRDLIEDIVISHLESLLTEKTVTDISSWVENNTKIYLKHADDELKSIRKELVTVAADANKMLDKILDGLDSPTARERLANLEARKLQLEIRITDLQITSEKAYGASKGEIENYLLQLKHLRTMDREQQAQIIKMFVERVEVYPCKDGNDGFKFRATIKTKLDELIPMARIENGTVSLRHVYPHDIPYWIVKTVTF